MSYMTQPKIKPVDLKGQGQDQGDKLLFLKNQGPKPMMRSF